MLRNVLIAITAAVLLGAISLLAAEKVKEKRAAEKDQPKQTFERQRPGMLLDELIAAYKANDREKMGQVIKKMEQRREKIQKFAQFNRWHRWAHRRMEMRSPGWGKRPEAGFNRGPEAGFYQHRWEGPRWRHGCGCCCEAQRSGVPVGGPCWGERNNWGPSSREYGRMPGFDRGQRPWREGFEGRGREDWTPEPRHGFGPELNPERQRMHRFGPYRDERPMPPRDDPSPDAEW